MLESGWDEVWHEAILEEQPAVEFSSQFEKEVDLSCKQISSLREVVEKGDMVLCRLKELQQLNLKQNNLGQLPADIMQVCCLSVCLSVCLPSACLYVHHN